MLKSILVPVRGDGMVATVLAHAAQLAKQHDAQVNVVHCRVQPQDLLPQGVPLNDFARKVMLEQAVELANRQEDHLRGILHRLAREFHLHIYRRTRAHGRCGPACGSPDRSDRPSQASAGKQFGADFAQIGALWGGSPGADLSGTIAA